MKKSPALLMKELKYIKERISTIHVSDRMDSTAAVKEIGDEPALNIYSYEANREVIKQLREREMTIHRALSTFNLTTKVPGFDLTISEGLLRLMQLKAEIMDLGELASRHQITTESSYSTTRYVKCCYDVAKAQADLDALRKERTALQVAIDRVNLTSEIDC